MDTDSLSQDVSDRTNSVSRARPDVGRSIKHDYRLSGYKCCQSRRIAWCTSHTAHSTSVGGDKFPPDLFLHVHFCCLLSLTLSYMHRFTVITENALLLYYNHIPILSSTLLSPIFAHLYQDRARRTTALPSQYNHRFTIRTFQRPYRFTKAIYLYDYCFNEARYLSLPGFTEAIVM